MPTGRYRFGIVEKLEAPVAATGAEYNQIMTRGGPPPAAATKTSVIPLSAQSPSGSPFVYEIKSGTNELDLDLSTVK